jgi:hypothetical protein
LGGLLVNYGDYITQLEAAKDDAAAKLALASKNAAFAAQLEKLQKLKGWSAEEIKKMQDLSARAAAAFK